MAALRIQRILISALCGLLLTVSGSVGLSKTKKKDDYPYLNYSPFGSTRSSGKDSSSKPKKKRKPRPTVDRKAPLAEQAAQEITVLKEEQTTEVVPTPATVKLQVEPVANPIQRPSFRLGVFAQPYRPEGSVTVGTLKPYDVSTLGTQPMIIAEGRWLPLKPERIPGLSVGIFGSLGYSQHQVNLRTPIGIKLENTKLHTMKYQGGLTGSWSSLRLPKWSFHSSIGAGHLDMVQSSRSSYANISSALTFASVSASVERSLSNRWSLSGGYEHRATMKVIEQGAALPRHSFLLGVMGNFQ